jgi:GH15 family glucan-1,4-alpha-glucosidase
MTRIEDYGFIGDTHSAALVGRDGSIDWLCLPRFDTGSIFGALIDPDGGGRWRLAPKGEWTSTRRYRDDTMVLETTFETPGGSAVLVDCLPLEEESDPERPREVWPHEVVVRIVRGISGIVKWDMACEPRFDYGYVMPWLRPSRGGVEAVGGPDALLLCSDARLWIEGHSVRSSFQVSEGESVAFLAVYRPSHENPGAPLVPADAERLVDTTADYWRRWAAHCRYAGRWRKVVVRSLLTLKALTYSPTGGIVAAPTTSLPESIGGKRNWDYRYCWLRDATYMLDVLLEQGYTAEAEEWCNWLLRAVAGDPRDIQIMYGVRGERRLFEVELPWLGGSEGSKPVRVGNAAVEQFQLDVYGEVMDSFHSARRAGISTTEDAWELECHIVDFVAEHWHEPDEGIWEVRSGREHFVHSKVMAWVAIDRAIKAVERFGLAGDVEEWRVVRAEIQNDVLDRGFDEGLGHFTRAYGSKELDANLLMLPLVGFLPATDGRMRATIEAIERDLLMDGFVVRYRSERVIDGLPTGEGAFLMCTLWLATCLKLLGRDRDAVVLFERIVGVCNDVGLLSEQYDPDARRLVGNFPQVFSHTALATTAMALAGSVEPGHIRRDR